MSGHHPAPSCAAAPRGRAGGRAVLRDAPRACRPPRPPPEGSFVIPAERRSRAPAPSLCRLSRERAPLPSPLRLPCPTPPPLPGRTFQRRRPAVGTAAMGTALR